MTFVFRMLIDKAVWWRIAVAFAGVLAGAFALFGPAATYSRLKTAFGALPEENLGHQPGQTLTFIGNLSEVQTAAYLGHQGFDFLYQTVVIVFSALVLARAIKAFPDWTARLERTLALPIALWICEAGENIFLALMISGFSAPLLEVIQQSFTTLKLWFAFALVPLTVVALGVAAVDGFRTAIGAKKT